jgi:hypothetical protein
MLEAREPHLDALAIVSRALEAFCTGMRASNVARAFVDAARDPSEWRLRTASGLEMAPGAVDETAAIEDRVSSIDPARRRQPLPRRADIRVSDLVVTKVLAREGYAPGEGRLAQVSFSVKS